jgi:hypothetical protein
MHPSCAPYPSTMMIRLLIYQEASSLMSTDFGMSWLLLQLFMLLGQI